jgi:ATP-binding cassette, subfamily B (MDR/TAP), member 1
MAVACSISGFVVGAVRGWAISLCILATAPFIAVTATMYGKALSGGMSTSLMAYSQSAGYAEQAMTAIRVVIAFGMEMQEVDNYTRYLDRAKKASTRTHLYTALAIASLWMIVYFSYAYSFFIGSLFV